MKTKEAIQEAEEHIRKLVRELPDEKRLLFFQQAEKNLKDPDTYATLNFLLVAGLHHFYLGQWGRGSINLFIHLCGGCCFLICWASGYWNRVTDRDQHG